MLFLRCKSGFGGLVDAAAIVTVVPRGFTSPVDADVGVDAGDAGGDALPLPAATDAPARSGVAAALSPARGLDEPDGGFDADRLPDVGRPAGGFDADPLPLAADGDGGTAGSLFRFAAIDVERLMPRTSEVDEPNPPLDPVGVEGTLFVFSNFWILPMMELLRTLRARKSCTECTASPTLASSKSPSGAAVAATPRLLPVDDAA